MFGPRTFWPTKIMNPKNLGPKSLVKIGPVTAEILLIWTNVARHMLPGILHGSKILPLKFGQNRVSDS